MEPGIQGFPGDSVVKNPPADAVDIRDAGSIPGSGRSPGGESDNPLQLFLPGKFYGWRNLGSYSPWGRRAKHNSATKQQQILSVRHD